MIKVFANEKYPRCVKNEFDSLEIELVEIDQDVIKILNWENFHQMSETFYEEGKVYGYRKIIEMLSSQVLVY